MTQAVTRLILLASLLSAPTTAQHDAHNAHGNPPPEVFESEDRAEWQRPEWVINQLGLVPTEVVTDIGAGSRYFSRRIARRLTGGGRVIAVDIDPTMLTFLADRITDDQITEFSEILTRDDRYPMLIRSASSNRVGGMLLLARVLEQNQDLAASL